MPVNVDVPTLGESVREAVLIKWHKSDGQSVSANDLLCELETDKANVDLPSPASGVLRRGKKEGDTVHIGETIARIEESGAAPSSTTGSTSTPSSKQVSPKPSVPPTAAPTGATTSASKNVDDQRPSVRRIVTEEKLNPSDLKGTGPGGKVTKEDATRLATTSKATSQPIVQSPMRQTVTVPQANQSIESVERVPMSKLRKKIAERLVEAQQTAAILTTFNEVDMSEIFSIRTKYKEQFQETHGVGLGFMSFFARACVLSLREFRNVNAQIDGDDIVYSQSVNLGIAVSTERGLAVPVLHNVESMSFARIESEIKRLAGAVREGKLALAELSGGTFTITNGGVFGSLLSTPILNPPQSGILGMHAIQKRAVVINDKIEIRPMMYIALSYDHRLVDGKESVSFLVRMKEYLEDPARLMLEV